MRDLPPELPESVLQAHEHARANGLIYVSDAEPGIGRHKRGTGFYYLGPDSKRVTETRILDRIRKLAIPPAYTEVWICTKERGHLQATGRDARRRKQYRYHAQWRSTRDDGKFTKMIEFGAQLPKLRRRLRQDVALPGLPKNKVLAVIVSLLDETLIRVGNEEYARTNQSYGLTTLRNKHVKFLRDGRASFNFRGKSGRQHEVVLDDRRLGKLIKNIQQLPGQALFQYVDDEGQRQPVDSGMVNEYLREVMGGNHDFTAKDFRTWGGTVRAIAFLSCQAREEPMTQRAFNGCVAATARNVAEALGNTPAVCRKSYINPVVFDAWKDGLVEKRVPRSSMSPRRMELAALALLKGRRKAQNKAKSKART
ncbi:MAG: DNA topoisomerase IB [Pseudomonadota bacterium]|nr:DNA topoisomerase IB [Pseudomonadota bacterium]